MCSNVQLNWQHCRALPRRKAHSSNAEQRTLHGLRRMITQRTARAEGARAGSSGVARCAVGRAVGLVVGPGAAAEVSIPLGVQRFLCDLLVIVSVRRGSWWRAPPARARALSARSLS